MRRSRAHPQTLYNYKKAHNEEAAYTARVHRRALVPPVISHSSPQHRHRTAYRQIHDD